MELAEYVDQVRGRQTELAKAVGCDPQLIWQWVRGVRPVPLNRCMQIERATDRLVRRWELRPNDWHLHWPELASEPGAPILAGDGSRVAKPDCGAASGKA